MGDLEVTPLHTPGHTAGMLALLVDGEVFTGDTLFKNSVGGVRAPGSTSYEDLRDSIMEHADGAAAGDRRAPRPHRPLDDRRRVGARTRSCASGAGSTPRATSPARRSASRRRWCCSATTTTAATRPGCAGPTGATTSCRARRSSAGADQPRGARAWKTRPRQRSRPLRACGAPLRSAAWPQRRRPSTPARARRTSTRSPTRQADALGRRQVEAAEQIVARPRRR